MFLYLRLLFWLISLMCKELWIWSKSQKKKLQTMNMLIKEKKKKMEALFLLI